MIDKGSSYFNIIECGRNLLDQLNFMYQCAFTASICSLYFKSVITLVGMSDESFCDKVSLTMFHSDSLTSIYILSNEGL